VAEGSPQELLDRASRGTLDEVFIAIARDGRLVDRSAGEAEG
jgi:hypothetical protein